MRVSCNGCRVLRKGCNNNCIIKPCLQWIKSPQSQTNAIIFLAKFYGRAGLVNLITAGPDHRRPEILRSLLYEACGRIVNPIGGSVGLLWSGNWQVCQNAVEAVLNGDPIIQLPSGSGETNNIIQGPTIKATYDIRHNAKDEENSTGSNEFLHVKNRCRFKRSCSTTTGSRIDGSPVTGGSGLDSSLSHYCESLASLEKVGGSILFESAQKLDLCLGFEPASMAQSINRNKDQLPEIGISLDGGDCKLTLGLDVD